MTRATDPSLVSSGFMDEEDQGLPVTHSARSENRPPELGDERK